MPLNNKSHKKLLLSVIIAGTMPSAQAADGWDCVQTNDGWNCTAAAIPAQASQPAAPAQPKPAVAPKAVETPKTEEAPTAVATEEPEVVEAPTSAVESQPENSAAQESPASDLPAAAFGEPQPAEEPVLAEEPKSQQESQLVAPPKREVAAVAEAPAETPKPPLPAGSYLNLDWVIRSPLETANEVCKGAYAEPQIWNGLLTPGNSNSATTIDADKSSSLIGGITELEGDVIIQQSGRQMESGYAEFDSANRQALLRSNVRYREPGFLLRSDAISADLDRSIAIANESSYVLHENELRGEALALTRYADKSIETQQSRITYCEPGNDDWAIRAQEMTLYPAEGYGESWHTRFEVAGVPVFYLPYFYFPLDDTRRSGLLYPTLSSSETDGYDLAIPYYFNIAPNVDDTLTARLIEHRGLLLENEARYLNRYSMNTLNTGWISDDDIYGDERWLLNFNHSGNPAPGFSSAIEYSRVSDNDYFDDLMPVEIRVPTSDNLNQRASLSYSAATWNASVLVNDYQTIDGGTEPYVRMPQLTLSGAESYSDLRLGYIGQFTEFKHDSSIDGQRLHLRPTLSYDWSRTWGYLRPELGLWNSSYDLSNNTSPSATANFASLDSGLIFERQGELATQTIEPRMKLISVGGDDTATLQNFDSSRLGFSAGNLFNTLGYSGNDRVAQTDQATLGLTSRVFSLSGREMVTASIAQAHYFNDHDARPGDASGTEDSSDYAVSASWKPSDVLKLSHDSRIDKDDGTLRSQNYGLMYNPDDAKLVYASFRQAKSNADTVTKEQIDLAAKWPLSPAWSVVGRYTEDLKESENLETLLGLEYGSCCWKIRFTGQRAVKDGSSDYERENALYLQFVLKGLGTLGGAEGREFLKDLTGFDEDKNENF